MRSTSATQHERILRYFARYVNEVRDAGIAGVVAEDRSLNDATITVRGESLVNFGNCSYSGLSRDPRLKAGAIDLVNRYGTSFSSSVAYASIEPLHALGRQIGAMFGGTALVLSTTTLAHLATLPVLVGPDSVVFVDAQAHASIHMACQVLRSTGISVETVRHNDMRQLRRLVRSASETRESVWYFADSLYSMFGDVAPFEELHDLLEEHENLWLYMDDAHGVGWAGPNGSGIALERLGRHERMVIAASLSKSFGSGGGAVVLPTPELAHRVAVAAGAYNFGGPLQPAAVGAGLVAAEVMLSEELALIRDRIETQIDLVLKRGRELGLPFAAWERTPIWFVRVGRHDQMVEIGRRINADGFHINPASFPIVPKDQSGIRFTHTLDNSLEQLDMLLNSIARHVAEVAGENLIDLAAEESVRLDS